MPFQKVVRALYTYDANDTDEISFKEDDLLIVIEKASEGDWIHVRLLNDSSRVGPTNGLAPANYIDEIEAIGKLQASYDYDAQEDNELSFRESELLILLVKLDDDWWLAKVGHGSDSKFGLVPSNYVVELNDTSGVSENIFTNPSLLTLSNLAGSISKKWPASIIGIGGLTEMGCLCVTDTDVLLFAIGSGKKGNTINDDSLIKFKYPLPDIESFDPDIGVLSLRTTLEKHQIINLSKSDLKAFMKIIEPYTQPFNEEIQTYTVEPENPMSITSFETNNLNNSLSKDEYTNPALHPVKYTSEVLHSYNADLSNKNEINVVEGNKVEVLENGQDSTDWSLVRVIESGRTGLMPTSYLKVFETESLSPKDTLKKSGLPFLDEIKSRNKNFDDLPVRNDIGLHYENESPPPLKPRPNLDQARSQHSIKHPNSKVKSSNDRETQKIESVILKPVLTGNKTKPSFEIKSPNVFSPSIQGEKMAIKPEIPEPPLLPPRPINNIQSSEQKPHLKKINDEINASKKLEEKKSCSDENEDSIIVPPIKLKDSDFQARALGLLSIQPGVTRVSIKNPEPSKISVVKPIPKENAPIIKKVRMPSILDDGPDIKSPCSQNMITDLKSQPEKNIHSTLKQSESTVPEIKNNPWAGITLKKTSNINLKNYNSETKTLPSRPISSIPSSKPTPAESRIWRDKSGTFNTEAIFVSFFENAGTVMLHKLNGNKISVPVSMLSSRDIEYVYRKIGKTAPTDDSNKMTHGKTIPNTQKYSVNGFDWLSFMKTEVGLPHDEAISLAAQLSDRGVSESWLDTLDHVRLEAALLKIPSSSASALIINAVNRRNIEKLNLSGSNRSGDYETKIMNYSSDQRSPPQELMPINRRIKEIPTLQPQNRLVSLDHSQPSGHMTRESYVTSQQPMQYNNAGGYPTNAMAQVFVTRTTTSKMAQSSMASKFGAPQRSAFDVIPPSLMGSSNNYGHTNIVNNHQPLVGGNKTNMNYLYVGGNHVLDDNNGINMTYDINQQTNNYGGNRNVQQNQSMYNHQMQYRSPMHDNQTTHNGVYNTQRSNNYNIISAAAPQDKYAALHHLQQPTPPHEMMMPPFVNTQHQHPIPNVGNMNQQQYSSHQYMETYSSSHHASIEASPMIRPPYYNNFPPR